MADNNTITVFAKTNFRNREVPFGIKTDDRRRHMYVIGKTGMGKTTLMENMVIQDIRNGHGVAFLDPHGDSVQRILDSVPNSRVNDVVYFNPADLEYPIAFNILEAVDTKYKHLVASGLMGVFTKIWANLWSARMEYILNNTILALLDSPGNTLLGITRMYVDKKYRKKIVDNVKDPMVRAFWVDEFANYNEKYRTEAIAPIQNKVGQFLSSGIIRNIVGQPKSTIDLRDIMDNQKILVMDLSKGRVGEDNSALLGAMLVTKLQLAAMSRTDIPEEVRKDFYLYVDEFQNFATESFATILSEARKYRLNLIVGHQYIAQLEQDKNTKVRDAIFGNVGTMVCFRVGAADAEFLETEFEPIFTPNDLVNLPKYQILLKLMINGVASEPFSAITVPPPPEYLTGNREKVIKVSRERYAHPVAEVEEKISRWMGAEFHQEAAEVMEASENGNKEIPEPTTNITTEKEIIIQTPKFEATIQSPEVVMPASEEPVVSASEPAARVAAPAPVAVDFSAFQGTKTSVPKMEPRREQGNKPPSLNYKNNREFPPKAESRFRNNQRNHFQPTNGKPFSPDRQAKPKPSAKKTDNPIWDTIASLRQEKVMKQGEEISRVVASSLDPDRPKENVVTQPPQSSAVPNVQHTEPFIQPVAKMEQSVPVQAVEPQEKSHVDRTGLAIPTAPRKVLKAGSTQKF